MSFPLKSLKIFCLLVSFLFVIQDNHAQSVIRSYQKEKDGVSFSLEKGVMNIRICMDDIVQIKYSVLNSFPTFNSLVVNNSFTQPVDFKVTENGTDIIISTSKLHIQVNRKTSAISYLSIDGKLITSEDNTYSKSMQNKLLQALLLIAATLFLIHRQMRHYMGLVVIQ